MDIQTLKNNDLIQLCANHPNHKLAWTEFYHRFDKTIWLFVYRECIRRGITKRSDQFEQTVQDLVQDVYIKLVEKNCKALHNFIGASENSIFAYLSIIIKNVVLNHVTSMSAQKRKSKKKSMDSVYVISDQSEPMLVKDIIASSEYNVEEQLDFQSLKMKIEKALNKINKGKHRERNNLIFKLHFYEGFSVCEIASNFFSDLSSKRIHNILSEMKNMLRDKLL